MYNNPYINSYNSQITKDRIDNQIAQLQQLKEQMTQGNQQPSINQTFQLASTPNMSIRYANSIDDVSKEIVYSDTPFFSHDLSVVWIKNNKGNINTYEMKEIVPKDEKDMIIANLQMQIDEMRKEIKNATTINSNVDEPSEDKQSSIVSSSRTSKKK